MNFNEKRTVLAPIQPSSKKFRFDSFATEFSEDNIKKESEYFPDNDSGIGKFIFKHTLISLN